MEIVGEYIIITCIQIKEERGTAPFARVFFPVFVGPPCPMYQKQTAKALFEQRQDSNSLIQINKTVAHEVTLIEQWSLSIYNFGPNVQYFKFQHIKILIMT